jgi:phage recombination protein Bet
MTLLTSAVDPEVSASLQIYERLKPLKDALGVANLSDNELQLFAIVARHTGLDPFTKQIYAIKRSGRVTHQTGIDGYRSVAERTGQYRGSDAPVFEACTCGADDSPPAHPKVARVMVYRAYPEGIRPQLGEARWHELKPKHIKSETGPYADAMWWQMPENQLAKCGEAAALRKAFPRVLGGVYVTDEMQGVETIEGQASEVQAPPPVAVRERVAARRQALESTAHGEEPQIADAVAEPSSEQPTAEPSAACGMASPYGEDALCSLAAGHAGHHRSESRESWA